MVLDPVSALGAAAAVIQFLDFGLQLISKGHELYKSGDGRLVEHAHISVASSNLTKQCEVLEQHARGKVVGSQSVPGEDGLADIVVRCLHLAEELNNAVDELRVSGRGQVFKSFRNAIKSIWSKPRLDKMLTELQNLRAELMMNLLIVLREEGAADTQKLMRANKVLESNILSTIKQVAAENRRQVNDLHQALRSGWLFKGDSSAKINAANAWLQNNHNMVNDFSSSLSQTMLNTSEQQIRIKIRDSLCFDEVFQRYAEVADAQAHTFDWVFDLEAKDIRWSSFGQWLQHRDADTANLYWVAGKPGSGKSTLLRYLCKNRMTQEYAKAWAGDLPVTLASCFLWNPGTILQKSQQGLLRSLLFQLLVEQPDFPPRLFPRRWQLLNLGVQSQYTWSDEELKYAILEFVNVFGQQHKLLIFVDGLDEYEGSDEQRQDVCDMLHQLAEHQSVKICASSRPWNTYVDAFKHNPKLRLEDLTKDDIQIFVDDAFASNRIFHEWATSEPEKSVELRNSIVDKAQGVFLWVRLVTNNLLKSLRARDDAHDLARRFDEIPADLEEYFQKMLDGLDRFYLEDAGHMFNIALTGSKEVMTYFFIHRHSIDKYLYESKRTFSRDEALVLEEAEVRRINARCMGLLEISEPDPRVKTELPLRMVDFLHRTARDFIASHTVQQQISSWLAAPTDTTMLELLSYTCQLATFDYTEPWMDYNRFVWLFKSSMRRCRKPSLSNPEETGCILKVLELSLTDILSVGFYRARESGFRRIHTTEDSQDPETYISGQETRFGVPDSVLLWRRELARTHTDFVGYAIVCDLDAYVMEKMAGWTVSQLHAKQGRPYLDYAAHPFILGFESLKYMPGKARFDMLHARIIARLCELGADPNQIWADHTIWDRFLQHTLLYFTIDTSAAFSAMKSFIEHGAVDVVRGRDGKLYITADPLSVAQTILSPQQAADIARLLDKSAHGTLTATTNRLRARFGKSRRRLSALYESRIGA